LETEIYVIIGWNKNIGLDGYNTDFEWYDAYNISNIDYEKGEYYEN